MRDTPNAPTAGPLTADETIAKRIAARAVQSLADSLPDEDTIEAQDRLKGTPQESLFVVSGEVLEELIAVTISNAIYDGELAAAQEPHPEGRTREVREAPEIGGTCVRCGNWTMTRLLDGSCGCPVLPARQEPR